GLVNSTARAGGGPRLLMTHLRRDEVPKRRQHGGEAGGIAFELAERLGHGFDRRDAVAGGLAPHAVVAARVRRLEADAGQGGEERVRVEELLRGGPGAVE